MAEEKKEFVEGMFLKEPREGAPTFVKGSISFKLDKFIPYLHSKANAAGYVNVDLLESKEGKLYVKLNDWKPATEKEMAEDEVVNVGE